MATTDTKTACPCCGRSFKTDAEGRMSRHGFARSRSGSRGRCDGSGRTVEEAKRRMVLVAEVEVGRLEGERAALADTGKPTHRIDRKIALAKRAHERALAAL